jgi:peroxiredoxin
MRATRHLSILAVALAVIIVGAGCSSNSGRGSAASQSAGLKTLLGQHQGKVLIVLMGREGCPGTAQATAFLDGYAGRKSAGVDIIRLDVPLPDENMAVSPKWDHQFPRLVDQGRRLADEVEFFYYPTLYVFDRQGQLRYTGACDGQRVEAMAGEMLVEKPNGPKKNYAVIMPAKDQPAPSFTGTTLAGKSATLAELRGQAGMVLVFAKTNCPFTIEALPAVRDLAAQQQPKGVAVAIINNGEQLETIRPVYAKHTPAVPVVWDASGEISKSYGVDVTPFFFLLDKDGKVAAASAFTPAAATSAVAGLLGQAGEPPAYRPRGAG